MCKHYCHIPERIYIVWLPKWPLYFIMFNKTVSLSYNLVIVCLSPFVSIISFSVCFIILCYVIWDSTKVKWVVSGNSVIKNIYMMMIRTSRDDHWLRGCSHKSIHTCSIYSAGIVKCNLWIFKAWQLFFPTPRAASEARGPWHLPLLLHG